MHGETVINRDGVIFYVVDGKEYKINDSFVAGIILGHKSTMTREGHLFTEYLTKDASGKDIILGYSQTNHNRLRDFIRLTKNGETYVVSNFYSWTHTTVSDTKAIKATKE